VQGQITSPGYEHIVFDVLTEDMSRSDYFLFGGIPTRLIHPMTTPMNRPRWSTLD
jgi:hypothetical protein